MILITTAGNVGSEAARLLARKDESVRLLIRDPPARDASRRSGGIGRTFRA